MMRGTSRLCRLTITICALALVACSGQTETVEPGVDAQDTSSETSAGDAAIPDSTPDTTAPEDTPSDAPPEQTGDETPPSVEFVQPLDGAEVEGLVAVEVGATDDTGVVSVELFMGGESQGIDEEAPYEFAWDATALWSGTYSLKAVALDAAGNAGEATIAVTVLGECDENGDCPPIVGFLAPEADAFVGGLVEIKASASDDDVVVKVRFLVDEGLLLEDIQVPYKAEWDTVEFDDGPHALALVAYDTTDKTAVAQVEVIVDNTPPEITLLTPEEGAILHDEILLSAEATDALQMDRVEFSVDGSEPEAISEEPWECVYDGTALAAGTHVVEATAFDAAGNETMVSRELLVDRPPVVSILAPGEGAVVLGPVTVQAEADDDLDLQAVSLAVDGAWYGDLSSMRGVWEIPWTPEYEKADRVLTVTALDGAGQETATAVTVQVDHPVTAALQLCAEEVCEPLGPDTELTGTVQIRATVEDDGAEIVSVDFLVDGEPAHQDLEAPFEFPWDTTSVEDGARLVEVVATNALAETGAAQVTVLVNNCDLDHDGFVATGCGGPDCDDGSGDFNPSAPDAVGDDIDQNCDGLDGVDADGDGYASEASGGDDCLDDLAVAHPCGDDLADDGVDGNCDGADELSCDDCIVCTVDGLVAGACVHASVEDGGACDDGDLCTGDGACQDLVCLPGAPVDCDDQELCTADGCVPDTGCYHLPLDGLPCDDGVCLGGACCAPACDGKECGDDGCGGACGECQGATTVCVDGACFNPEACGCAPWQTCTLQDGCVDPESLGESPYGGVIVANDCFGVTWEGCCAGDALYYCDTMSGECPGGAEVCLVKLACAAGSVCGWSADDGFFQCASPPALPDPQGGLSCGWYVCAPDCAGRDCGPDGCGGSCGACPEGEACFDGGCHPEEGCVAGTTPGCDGCLCEACVCALDPYCCETAWDGICVQECVEDCGGCGPCVPDCTGKVCGDDGCGGTCGACEGDSLCCGGGCLPLICTIENEHGVCHGPTVCANGQGTCAAKAPDPEVCNGLDDDCDGAVDEGFQDVDQDGQADCVDGDDDGDGWSDAVDNCPWVHNPFQVNSDSFPDGGDACDPDDDNDGVLDVVDNCPVHYNPLQTDTDQDGIGDVCENCIPICDGRECGPDSCGGTCGTCPEGAACDMWGDCSCMPVCAGKQCGIDGCGGSCGQCPFGESCTPAGQCEVLPYVCGQGICEVPLGETCQNCPADCGPCFEGDCCEVHDWPGCEPEPDVMECVCWYEPGCCLNHWASMCVDVAIESCGLNCGCEPDCNGLSCTDGCGGFCEGPCNDGKICTLDDVCVEGTCVGTPFYCSDGNECTDDICLEAVGCVHQPLDEVPCAEIGVCVEGECICFPDCENKVCGDDGCGGSCGSCEELWACTPEGTCEVVVECGDGICMGPQETCKDCFADCGPCFEGDCCEPHDWSGCEDPDILECVWDSEPSCYAGDWTGLCVAAAVGCGLDCVCQPDCEGKTCGNDGCGGSCGACDEESVCFGGACVQFPVPCEGDADCLPFEDGDLCNGTLHCVLTQGFPQCVLDPATVVECQVPPGVHALCNEAVCEPSNGTCALIPANDGGLCDDGDPCMVNDHCSQGTCAGVSLSCSDGNPCTDDFCFPMAGCTYQYNEDPCEDGNACTTGDACLEGSCLPGQLVDCDDGDACSVDACDPQTGCVSTPVECVPGDACTVVLDCDPNTGCLFMELSCDDGNPCTEDSCHPATGCVHEGLDDQSPCWEQGICVNGQCVCIPDCDGKECGGDGCGGACGVCAEGDACHTGVCVDPVWSCAGHCDDTTGQCWCDEACFEFEDCCEDVCDWCPDLEGCAQACVPDCEGKECGDDGCGGSCGECVPGQVCEQDVCAVPSCQTDLDCPPGYWCPESTCEEIPACPLSPTIGCGSDIPGSTQGLQAGWDGYGCTGPAIYGGPEHVYKLVITPETLVTVELSNAPFDSAIFVLEDYCSPGITCLVHDDQPGTGVPETVEFLAETGHTYYLVVDGVTVSDMGSFNLSVTCCTPNCAGKDCGDDGCGGSCGDCADPLVCSPDGTCEVVVVCGDGDCDAPDEDCQSCPADCGACTGCEETGKPGCDGCVCEADVCSFMTYCCQEAWSDNCAMVCELLGECGCAPHCDGKECGDDFCGGSCGECEGGFVCTPEGVCEESVVCGDGFCNTPEEDCQTCPEDCGCVLFYEDLDGDGFGGLESLCACGPVGAYTADNSLDCNDDNPDVNPGAPESCSTVDVDDNCNDDTNDVDAVGCTLWWVDLDGDGFAGTQLCHCEDPGNTGDSSEDCCDTDPDAHPGQVGFYEEPVKECGGYDYNCDEYETKKYPSSCVEPPCAGGGWFQETPGCGQTGNWCLNCSDCGVCIGPLIQTKQECH